MSVMRNAAAVAVMIISSYALAQAPPQWHDELIEHMAGMWKLDGQVMGREAHHEVRAEWVLNHQFLRLHEKTSANSPSSERPYEALWFIGYDAVRDRYVEQLLDVFGVRYSETLGYGTRDGNTLRMAFEYPDGPFHTTYKWSPQQDSWQWLLEEKDKDGKWKTFADFRLTRAGK
jgi:hypothetical protein